MQKPGVARTEKTKQCKSVQYKRNIRIAASMPPESRLLLIAKSTPRKTPGTNPMPKPVGLPAARLTQRYGTVIAIIAKAMQVICSVSEDVNLLIKKYRNIRLQRALKSCEKFHAKASVEKNLANA